MALHLEEAKEQIARAKLSPQCARIAALRFFHRWEQDDIADEIGISQQRVSQHLAKAIRRCPQLASHMTPRGRLIRHTR